jgi:LPS-assembly protein
MNKFLILIVIFIFFLIKVILANTQDNTYINTKNLIYNEEKNIVELLKNSKININDINISIDRGIIDYDNDQIEVFGNFYLYQNLSILSGKDLIGNLNLTRFSANDVSFIYNDDLKIDSNKANRSDYIIEYNDNFLTPCDLNGYFNCPTWSLKIDKTRYDLNLDKFKHYDSFLQIADYKVFYLPYFSHFGAKAPRQKGFLTPTIQFVIGGNTGIKTPYYYPLKSNTDILITPTFSFNENLEFLENYEIDTKIQRKDSGGSTEVLINSQKNDLNDEISNTFNINTKQVLNKNTILSANGIFTNSISTTRSNNEEPISFEDMFIKVERFNLFIDSNRDYLKSEVMTVESFESTSDLSNIPISPYLAYHNYYNFDKNNTLENHISYRLLNRDESDYLHPSENYIFKLNSFYNRNFSFNEINTYNKISVLNSFYDSKFSNDNSLNRKENISELIFSSDWYFNINKKITPRIKLIHPFTVFNTNNVVNEDSEALSFSYVHKYSDSRLYGSDLLDNTSRLIFGLENDIQIDEQNLKFNINQSYDFKKNNNYANKVNQTSNLSDYSLELKTNYKEVKFKSDIRIDRESNSKKEMNYSLNFNKIADVEILYNETSRLAFKELSEDTQTLKFNLSKNINDNLSIQYLSSLDLKNNFNPYSSTINLNIFDDCSALEISYLNTRFNDNYNTKPEEIISFKFSMDYIGFFGYEQKTNLLFKEAGDFNYGL